MLIAFASLTPGTTYAALANQDRASQQPSSQTSKNTLGDHPRGAKHAAPNDVRKARKDENVSDERRGHRHISDKNHPRSVATVTKERFPSRNAANPRQPGSDKSSGAAKGGFIRGERVNSAMSPGPPNVIRPSVPSLNNVRHRGPNPAVVSGSLKSDDRNTGTINGTRAHRKP
jgi:hypothetical protein